MSEIKMQQITTAWNGIPVDRVTGMTPMGKRMTARTCCECGEAMKKAEGWKTEDGVMRNVHYTCFSKLCVGCVTEIAIMDGLCVDCLADLGQGLSELAEA